MRRGVRGPTVACETYPHSISTDTAMPTTKYAAAESAGMSLHADVRVALRSMHPLAVEFGIVTATLACVSLSVRLVPGALSSVFESPSAFDGLLVGGLVNGGLLLAVLVVFAGAYVRVRDIDVGLTLPTASDLPAAAVAVLTPLALVGLTKLVGVATGVPYNALTKSSVAPDAPLRPILRVSGLGLLVGVPTRAVLCQVLVQGSFERVVDGDGAVALTTLLTGFLLVSDAGGLTTVPDRGKLAGAVVFAFLLGVALLVNERADRDWVRVLAAVPAAAFVALVVLSGIAGVGSVAAALFALATLATLGVAAATYHRTRSLLVPALAYASLLFADRAVVIVFEAGMRSW